MSVEIDLALGGEVDDLHGLFAGLRRLGPLARVRYFGEPAWILLSYDAVEAAYRDDVLFPAEAAFREMIEPVMGRTLQCMSGEEHTRNRRLVSPSFRVRVMPAQVRPVIEEVANELIDGLIGRGEADLVEDFDRQLPGAVITRMLGIGRSSDVDLQRWAHQILNFPSDPAAGLAARDEFTRLLAPLVAERRLHPTDDLISVLAHADDGGERLDDEQIFSFVRLLFAAGTDTAFLGLGNALYALLRDPEQLEAARSGATELRWVVEEALRWESPVSMEPRRAPVATEWFGQPIEAGARLLFGIAAANRDPSVFADPDRFDPGRRPDRIMTFGIGVHFCLGAHLARAELEVGLAAVLGRLADLRLEDVDATTVRGTVLRGPDQLRVRFRPERSTSAAR